MKKFVYSLLTFLFVLTFAFGALACDVDNSQLYNQNNEDEIVTDDDNNDVNDDDTVTTLTKQQYGIAFNSVYETYNYYISNLGQNSNSQSTDTTNNTMTDDGFIDIDLSNYYDINRVQGIVRYAVFLKKVCDNDNFVLTEDTYDFKAIDARYNYYEYSMRSILSYNYETNIIKVEMLVIDQLDHKGYVELEVNYNFNLNVLNSCKLKTDAYGGNLSDTNFFYYKFIQTETSVDVKKLSPEHSNYNISKAEIQEKILLFSQTPFADYETLPDYSTEYLESFVV